MGSPRLGFFFRIPRLLAKREAAWGHRWRMETMTTSDIQLPKADDPDLGVARKSTDVRFPQGDKSLRTSTIMIVDDEPINVTVVRKYLSLAGYENFATTNEPRDAIALAYSKQPDIILLDIMMPQVSGLDLLAACGPIRAGRTFRSSF